MSSEWQVEQFDYTTKRRSGMPVFVFDGQREVCAVRWSEVKGGTSLYEAYSQALTIARAVNNYDAMLEVLGKVLSLYDCMDQVSPEFYDSFNEVVDGEVRSVIAKAVGE